MKGENRPSKPQSHSDLVPLVVRASIGDAEAFAAIVARFQDLAAGYAYSLLGDYHLAEDAAQEAFVAAWQLLPQLREPAGFPGWFRRVIFKHCDRIRRTRQPHLPLEAAQDEAERTPGPAAQLETASWRQEIWEAVSRLPDAERDVVLLFYFGGQSHQAIGRFMDLPSSTIKSRLFSARKKLRQRMLHMFEETMEETRPSHGSGFTRKVMQMIRPSDRELGEGSGSRGCAGADIWAMMSAAVSGDVDTIRALLEKDRNLALAEYWYTPPLHYAVREGHLEAVKLLIEAGADPTYIRYGGEDLKVVATDRNHDAVAAFIAEAQKQRMGSAMENHEIHGAVTQGELDRVRDLLQAEPELVNRRDAKGRTPLHLAANAGHEAIAELLIDHGADLEARTGSNDTYLPAEFTPLDFAVWNNDWWIWPKSNWAMADLLIRRGAHYSIAIAAAKGDAARVEELLTTDNNQANAAQPCGRRPLSAAVQFGHLDIARRLLEAGADPSLPEGRYVNAGTALYFAARQKQYEMVDLLLEHGARTDGGIDSCGLVYHVADDRIKTQLYRYGLQPTEVDTQNVDALAIWAAKDPEGLARAGCGTVYTMIVCNDWSKEQGFPDEKKEAILRMLLAMGVKVPPVVTGCAGYLWQKPKFTRILLENGMDPNLPNWQLVTPLHSICNVGPKGKADPNRHELADLFLEFGADINARDEEYRSTPLGWAARSGLQDMVELLLSRGAAVELPDDEPWATPLAWARKRGREEIERILLEHQSK